MSEKTKWGHDNPPPGYAPCTRSWPHDGPCALPFKKDVAERMADVTMAKLLAETGEVTSPPDVMRLDDLGRMFDDLPPIPPPKPLVEMKPIQRALVRRPEPAYSARPPAPPSIRPELVDDYWNALTRLQARVDGVLRRMTIDGFDGVVDVRLFHVDADGRTLRASIVEVDDENARKPDDGTVRWRLNGKECRRIG